MTEPRTSLIVPLMQARVPVELQLEFPLPPGEEPIREAFTDELYVSYGFESEDEDSRASGSAQPAPRADGAPPRAGLEYVARRHCAELGLDPADLRWRAAANLRTRRPDLSLTWDPDVRAVAVAFGGDLEAGLLLDETFLDKLAQDVDGDLVVAVPARDVFLASGTGHPDAIDRLRGAVDHVWSSGGGHPLLTRELLVRAETGWRVHALA